MIDRYQLVTRHNVRLNRIEYDSPVSVGNGEFVFTVDVTGLQSLYKEYKHVFPLCTMGNFGWHTENDHGRPYSLDDLHMTEYEREGKHFLYPVKNFSENTKVYDWLRENPHKVNLYRLGLELDKKPLESNQLIEIDQTLDLYRGVINSSFCITERRVVTKTVCDSESNQIAFQIETEEALKDSLSLVLEFPYGSSDITGSDWEHPQKHESLLIKLTDGSYLINRVMDDLIYQVQVTLKNAELLQDGEHRFVIELKNDVAEITVTADSRVNRNCKTFEECIHQSEQFWKSYWEQTGIVDFGAVKDARAYELERREILSLYLLRLQCAGTLPPAETGLSCNSWYGKFHLEMHFWHSAYLPFYSQGDLLEKSVVWYRDHLKQARENAERNGYKGARWPKMVGYDGMDSPSPIAPLLVWQQPHIIFMLELLYQLNRQKEYLEKYSELVWETADFMADFAEWNDQKQVYELKPPLIPVQETHDPEKTLNPVFELEYWKETLKIAELWAERMGMKCPERWKEVREHMAVPTVYEHVYLIHEHALDTYSNHAKDHPSMLMAYGLLKGEDLNAETMKRTLEKVLETWDFDTSWGWDFAVMAMTAVRLGMKELAVDLLLKDTQKNEYIRNGHNKQGHRKDLPLYLPGNGSFLYALAMMTIGYQGCKEENLGFPADWDVKSENLRVLY